MNITRRLALACAIIVVDGIVFFLPISALFLGFVIVVNPRWARRFLDSLDRPAMEPPVSGPL